MIETYKLKRPEYKWEIYIPYYEQGELVTYTLRHIGNNSIRYNTLSKDSCVYTSQETLFGFDQANRSGYNLYVVEGTFDCMKIGTFGLEYGTSAVALSGKNITDRQLRLLKDLSSHYEKTYLTLDQDTEIEQLHILSKMMKYMDVQIKRLPAGIKDPGEFTYRQFKEWGKN